MSEDFDRTLLQIPLVYVFKIPTRMSAEGYRASDWPKESIWSGKLRITARDRNLTISLIDPNNGSIFANCYVTDENAVEKTLDSGRYFVLRITNNTGRNAFIGIAFGDRNHAFDFNVALSEFTNEIEREEEAKKLFDNNAPPLDLQLQEGTKLKIKMNIKKKEGESSHSNTHSNTSFSSGGAFLPPPSKDTANLEFYASKGLVSSPPPTTTSSSSVFSADPFASSAFSSDPFASDPFASNTNTKTDPFATQFKDPFSNNPF